MKRELHLYGLAQSAGQNMGKIRYHESMYAFVEKLKTLLIIHGVFLTLVGICVESFYNQNVDTNVCFYAILVLAPLAQKWYQLHVSVGNKHLVLVDAMLKNGAAVSYAIKNIRLAIINVWKSVIPVLVHLAQK